MFLLNKPRDRDIESLLARAGSLRLSYSPVGIARGDAHGFNLDVLGTSIGSGRGDFDAAKRAIDTWQMFNIGWCEVFPKGAATTEGTNVAVIARHLGFWSLNSCRVVYGMSDGGDEEQYGFAYGTLTEHAEQGEEIFAVSFNSRSEEVSYLIRAASRPRALLAKLGYPFSRWYQARFRDASTAAMRKALT
ncbi:MAG TPA: DUF1990 domain-containing protein [Thermoanaerobaculia bacterium]|nr:DUF1990 domain-containing protein [Thermoanaerobaculia bacterium]